MSLIYARLIIGSVYVATFLLGLTGNLFVFTIVVRFRCLSRKSDQYDKYSIAKRSMLYILVLAAADLLELFTAPLSLLFILDISWAFGSFVCRVHSAIDIAGKLFSVVTLMCISVERYCMIRNAWRYNIWKRCMNLAPLSIGIVMCVAVPVVPWTLYTDAYDITWQTDAGENATRTMCINTMPDDLFLFTMSYLLLFGFILPLSVMSVFYCLLIHHVRRRFRQRVITSGYVKKPQYICELTRSVLRVSAFHFLCWTPFWFFTIAPIVIELLQLNADGDSYGWIMHGRMFANLFPYVNSSGNWIFYAALNRDIQKRLEENARRVVTRAQNANMAASRLRSSILKEDSSIGSRKSSVHVSACDTNL